MGALSVSDINGTLRLGKGVLYVRPYSSTDKSVKFTEMGLLESCSVTPSIERSTVTESRFGNNVPAAERVDSAEVQGSFTSRSLLDLSLALAFQTGTDAVAQSEEADIVFTAADVAVGDIYRLAVASGMKATSVTVTAFTDGEDTPIAYTAGTHYELDAQAGLIKILAIPDTAGTDIEVTFTAGATTDTVRGALLSATDGRWDILFRGNEPRGTKVELFIPNARISPDGDISLIGEEDTTIGYSVLGFSDSSQPTGFELGYFEKLTA